jgi:hypothetical protein
MNGNVDAARQLLTQHPELAQHKATLNGFLRDAARDDKVELVALLVGFGADINAPKDSSPEGAIADAAWGGAIRVVRWMLDRGAKLNFEVDGMRRCFPLVGAVVGGHLEVVKLLVEHGADVNATWIDVNPLSYAIMYGRKEIEAYLRSKGAKEPSELGISPRVEEESPIVAHYEEHYGESASLSLGEILPGDPPITIHCMTNGVWQILGTEGMSSLPMAVPKGSETYQFAELNMFLPLDWPLTAEALSDPRWSWPLHWLRKLARYPHEQRTWLRPTEVVANGEPPKPLGPNTQLSCFLLMSADAERGRLSQPDGSQIVFLTVFPIYREERDLERKMGAAHLIKLFRASRIDMALDINRKNVAVPSRGGRKDR